MKNVFATICALLYVLAEGVYSEELVLLDIGHSTADAGATSPDGRISECLFWYGCAGEIKREIEEAGYRCIICNRGYAPKKEPWASLAKAAGVVQLNRPDKGGARYPSRYFPDRIGAGMVSADFGIEQKPACMVFLHLNSVGRGWQKGHIPGLIIYNRNHGRALGESLRRAFETELYDTRAGGMPQGGKGCRVITRYRKEETAAGWLNALDDAGIPAAVTEAIYVSDRDHVNYISVRAGARRVAHAVAQGILGLLGAREEMQYCEPNL